jgi:Transglutaminase-like superfamily
VSAELRWKIRTALAALALPPLLWMVSFARLAAWIGRRRPIRTPAPAEADLAAWTDQLLRHWPPPWRYTCLKRSVVLHYLLVKAGRPATLHIGVRRDAGGAFTAHAWLSRGSALLLEPPSSQSDQYRVIASFPEPSPVAQ